jgi:hypothetical protein
MKEALLSHQEPCEEVVERLEAILLELERLPLPANKVGAALLDTLESADGFEKLFGRGQSDAHRRPRCPDGSSETSPVRESQRIRRRVDALFPPRTWSSKKQT